MSGENDDIVVTGSRYDPILEEWRARPQTIDEEGLGGGGLGSGGITQSPNPPEYPHGSTSECPAGAAEQVAEVIKELLTNGQRFEYGAVLVNNPDGSVGTHAEGIHTSYSSDYARLSLPTDRSTIVGTVHNHPLATLNSHTRGQNNVVSYNANQRYPSNQDWDILDAQAASGADSGNLSVFIQDGFGTLREFKYADKDKFKSQTDQQRVNGEELPDPTDGCPPA